MKKVLAGLLFTVAATGIAAADPTEFGIESTWNGGGLVDAFGSSADGPYTFGTSKTFFSQFFGPGFNATVTSGPSPRPGFDYELVVDLAAWAPGDFAGGTFTFDMLGVKAPGSNNPVTDVQVKDAFGNPLGAAQGVFATTNGSDILIDAAVDAVAGGFGFSVQWNQVPEPASLSLLGLGAMGLIRRRR